ncbi:MAG: antibiotic biosynthesis monooxygenase [Actinomycetota bacterium]|nr:antibiotic biosynthesis monooxygenase [Actinomycetota bacterium]
MLAATRCRVPPGDAEDFLADAQTLLGVLAEQPGYVTGSVARAVDDPTLWLVSTRWADVGAYRRALGAYDVKVVATPLLSRALAEPSAYEILAGDGAGPPNRPEPRRLDDPLDR